MKSPFAERWFFLVLLLLTIALVACIFKPFFAVLVIGASLAVVLSPVHHWCCDKKVPSTLSALLTTVLFVIALGGPLFAIGTVIFHQAQTAYQDLANGGGAVSLLDSVDQWLQSVIPSGYSFDLRVQASKGLALIATNLAGVFTSTISMLLAIALTFMSVFYFLKDGPRWLREAVRISPLYDQDDEKILAKLGQAVNGILRGYLFIAVLQGILIGVGLAMFGVPNPALWGLVAMFASLLPTIGTAFVSIPAVLFLVFTGNMWGALGFGLWAALLVGMIDNFLSPIVVGNKVQIPPLFILFAVLGGIVLFGPVGLLVGPLAVSLLHTLLIMYRADFSKKRVK